MHFVIESKPAIIYSIIEFSKKTKNTTKAA